MDVNSGEIRNLDSPEAPQKSLQESEVGISQELALEILKKRGHTTCNNCGKEMNAGRTGATGGLCVDCSKPGIYFNRADDGVRRLVKRQERRTSRKARKIARRMKRND